MSRTRHHKEQKSRHIGHEYSRKYQCNKMYTAAYGTEGRDLADKERREVGKKLCRNIEEEV